MKVVESVFLMTFPGMTTENIQKYLPKLIATTMGHLQQHWKNTRLTIPKEHHLKVKKTFSVTEQEKQTNPKMERIHNVYINVIDV